MKVNGAMLYCPPYDVMNGTLIAAKDYFYNNFFGLYTYVLGMYLNMNLRRLALPQMRKYCSEEEGDRMQAVLAANKDGLRTLEEEIFAPMFGFKNLNDYYRGITLAGNFHKIRVPTFGMHTIDD